MKVTHEEMVKELCYRCRNARWNFEEDGIGQKQFAVSGCFRMAEPYYDEDEESAQCEAWEVKGGDAVKAFKAAEREAVVDDVLGIIKETMWDSERMQIERAWNSACRTIKEKVLTLKGDGDDKTRF